MGDFLNLSTTATQGNKSCPYLSVWGSLNVKHAKVLSTVTAT